MKRKILFGVLVTLSMLFVGCGSSSGSSSGSSATDESLKWDDGKWDEKKWQ